MLSRKKCYNPHDGRGRARLLQWGLSSYGLNRHPPFHLMADDVHMDLDTPRNQSWSIMRDVIWRGLGGENSAKYLPYWGYFERPSWEHEEDLKQCDIAVPRYYIIGRVIQCKGAHYRKYRKPLSRRAVSRAKGQRYVLPGYKISCLIE